MISSVAVVAVSVASAVMVVVVRTEGEQSVLSLSSV